MVLVLVWCRCELGLSGRTIVKLNYWEVFSDYLRYLVLLREIVSRLGECWTSFLSIIWDIWENSVVFKRNVCFYLVSSKCHLYRVEGCLREWFKLVVIVEMCWNVKSWWWFLVFLGFWRFSKSFLRVLGIQVSNWGFKGDSRIAGFWP